MKNRIVLLALILALLLPTATLFAQGGAEAAADQTYNVRMPSAEAEGDFMTVWARNFAKFMKEETDGRWNIEVFTYGTLGLWMDQFVRSTSQRTRLALHLAAGEPS